MSFEVRFRLQKPSEVYRGQPPPHWDLFTDGEITFVSKGEAFIEHSCFSVGVFARDLHEWLPSAEKDGGSFAWNGSTYDCGLFTIEVEAVLWRFRLETELHELLGASVVDSEAARSELESFCKGARSAIRNWWLIDILDPPRSKWGPLWWDHWWKQVQERHKLEA